MPVGHHVREFYLQDMVIHGCLGCEGYSRAQKGTDNPCVQKDDMAEINKAFMSSYYSLIKTFNDPRTTCDAADGFTSQTADGIT